MAFSMVLALKLIKIVQVIPPDSFSIESGAFVEGAEWSSLTVKVRPQALALIEKELVAQGIDLRKQHQESQKDGPQGS